MFIYGEVVIIHWPCISTKTDDVRNSWVETQNKIYSPDMPAGLKFRVVCSTKNILWSCVLNSRWLRLDTELVSIIPEWLKAVVFIYFSIDVITRSLQSYKVKFKLMLSEPRVRHTHTHQAPSVQCMCAANQR